LTKDIIITEKATAEHWVGGSPRYVQRVVMTERAVASEMKAEAICSSVFDE
jgi:hypothetical protein